MKQLNPFLYRKANTRPDKLYWETYRDATTDSGGKPLQCQHDCRNSWKLCSPDVIAVHGFLLSGLPGHVLSTSFLASKPSPPAEAVSWSRAGSSFPQRRSFVSLADLHSQEQKERASQEQPLAEHDGEIGFRV